MATIRAKNLEKLAANLPGANQQVVQGLQAARQTQLQEQIKSLQPGGGMTGGFGAAAQNLAATQTQQAGAINLQAAQQGQAQQQQIGQLAVQGQARQQRQAGFEQQIRLDKDQNVFANQLNGIDSRAKNLLLDDQLEFKQDQAGQTLMNQRQRADWVLSNAKNVEEMQNYMQAEEQAYKKELILLESSYNRISTVLDRGYIKEGQALDNAQKKKLLLHKQSLEKAFDKKQNEARNRSSMWKTGGQIIGGIAAGVATGGNPVAIMAGAQLGGGLGEVAAGSGEAERIENQFNF